jgi:hypothetical protein
MRGVGGRWDEDGSPLVRVAPGVLMGELSQWTDANAVCPQSPSLAPFLVIMGKSGFLGRVNLSAAGVFSGHAELLDTTGANKYQHPPHGWRHFHWLSCNSLH